MAWTWPVCLEKCLLGQEHYEKLWDFALRCKSNTNMHYDKDTANKTCLNFDPVCYVLCLADTFPSLISHYIIQYNRSFVRLRT